MRIRKKERRENQGVNTKRLLLSRLLYLAGLGLILWLPVQGIAKSFQSEQAIKQMIQLTTHQSTQQQLAKDIEAANEHQDLSDPFSSQQPSTHFSDAVGQIDIPKIGEKLPLFIGADDGNLARGVGQILGTDLPMKGKGTHSVLAGHRGWYGANFFLNINQLAAGDLIYLSYLGKESYYVVTYSELIDPSDTDRLSEKDPAIEQLTLLTCHPLFYTWQRLLVHSRALTEEETTKLLALTKDEKNNQLPESISEASDVISKNTVDHLIIPTTAEKILYSFHHVQYFVYWIILGFGCTSGLVTIVRIGRQVFNR